MRATRHVWLTREHTEVMGSCGRCVTKFEFPSNQGKKEEKMRSQERGTLCDGERGCIVSCPSSHLWGGRLLGPGARPLLARRTVGK